MQHLQKSRAILEALILTVVLATTTAASDDNNGRTLLQVLRSFEVTFNVNPVKQDDYANSICATGEFVGKAAASALSRSQLFTQHPVPVVARFSVAGGGADTSRNAREMALEFRFLNGALQDMAMLNTPIFRPADPTTFNDMIVAVKPDPMTGTPDRARLHDFLASHPDAFAKSNFLTASDPPPSYSNSAYFSMHTFRFIDADGRTHFVRWRFIPHDGERSMTPSQVAWTAGRFLNERLVSRLSRGPVQWDMIVSLGKPGDTTDNPSIAWPEGRKHFNAGTLTINRATSGSGAECERIRFEPLSVADGIAPADDPVLLFRSPTYAQTFVRRVFQALPDEQDVGN